MLKTRVKAALLYFGLLLIASATIIGSGFAFGLIQLPDQLIGNEATVHSIARIAVIGCMCAALGSMEKT